MAALARRPRSPAIFASNDEMAAGVYKAAFRLKISIPDELSMVGFDDSPVASRLSPTLTTIRLPIRDMARPAASKLLPVDGAPGEVVVGGGGADCAAPGRELGVLLVAVRSQCATGTPQNMIVESSNVQREQFSKGVGAAKKPSTAERYTDTISSGSATVALLDVL